MNFILFLPSGRGGVCLNEGIIVAHSSVIFFTNLESSVIF